MFGGGGAAGATPPGRPDANNVFGDVFEEVRLPAPIFVTRDAYHAWLSFYVLKYSVMALGGRGPVEFVVLV